MSITGPYIPNRGDIVWIEFSPQTGYEIEKKRPALVLSNYRFNRKTNFAFVVPITKTRRDHFVFSIQLPDNLCAEGFLLLDQIKSQDYVARKAEFACRITDENFLREITKKIVSVLQGRMDDC